MKNWWTQMVGRLTVWYWQIRKKITGAKVDISQINDQLWAGGAVTTVQDVAQMVASGITADIDCRQEFNDQSLISGYSLLPPTPASLKDHSTIAYLWDGVADDGQPKPVEWFEKAWVFAQPILDGKGTVLCHCAAGVNRGPSMASFLLMAYWHMTPDEAKALLIQKRPVAQVAYLNDATHAVQQLGLEPKAQ